MYSFFYFLLLTLCISSVLSYRFRYINSDEYDELMDSDSQVLTKRSPLIALAEKKDNWEQRTVKVIPRSSLLISGRGFMPGFADHSSSTFLVRKRSDSGKRSGGYTVAVPRSGFMIGGRGWMPGFSNNMRVTDDWY